MSYETIEARYKTLLEPITLADGTSAFEDEEDVSRGDYRILDSGGPRFTVLTPGPIDESDALGSYGSIFRIWGMIQDLFVRYTNDPDSWSAFIDVRDAVLQLVEENPTLNDLTGIIRTRIVTEGDPVEVFDEDDEGPFFILQRLRVTVTERVDRTGGEYAT